MTDEEVIRRVQEGDKEMFGEIVERYWGKLASYIRRMTNQPEEEVEDLLENVLVSAYVNIQGFDTGKKFSSWIYRIAHNKSVDYFKKNKPKRLEDDEMLADSKKLMEEMEIDKEERNRIRKAVERLEVKYREVILLYYFEDKNYEEISDILHVPVDNVGVMLFRAKNKLRQIYEV